ncbi:flagellar protein FlaG [Photobacterium japonica]|uniref:flagellar protein FlaG n=1 Tax=Photobacterium japonica TaxID=2910235 RepID=UPI003D0F3784
MEITPISPSSLPPLTSPSASQTPVGTDVASNTISANGSQSVNSVTARATHTVSSGMAASAPSNSAPSTAKPLLAHSVNDARQAESRHDVEQQRQQQREALEKVVERIEEFVGSTINKGLAFRIDEASGKHTVTIYDKSTGDVVRQLPDEDMLALSRQLVNHSGGLVTTKV